MTVAACSLGGAAVAAAYKKEAEDLHQLQRILEWMQCSLQCKGCTFAQLFRDASSRCDGAMGQIFADTASQLRLNAATDVGICLEKAIANSYPLPAKTRRLLLLLSRSVGELDLEGQLRQLRSVQTECGQILQEHCYGLKERQRCCQTVGICVGLGIAILLI